MRAIFRSVTEAIWNSAGRGPIGLAWIVCLLACVGCGTEARNEVVVYASQDQVFAEPLFESFTRETGILVKAVFDSEAVKTVGLANRLIAEASNPRCDVFWNNEEFRTRLLERRGLWRAERPWIAFGARHRILVVNTNLATPDRWPRGLVELTNSVWRSKVVLAYPVFGTTASHFLILRARWGDSAWDSWCRAFASNGPRIVDGNSVAARLVARGEAEVALTDSDDFEMLRRERAPVAAIRLLEDGLVIPNTVAVLRGAPHPKEAEVLFRYLASASAVEKLAALGAILEGSSDRTETALEWDKAIDLHAPVMLRLKELFLR